ncbi:MAG: HEAT repeat domain-containing protein, partial [Planctomycetota bacterium]
AAEKAEVAVPVLMEALGLDDPFMRARGAQTLSLFKDERAAAGLIQALYDEDEGVRRHALTALTLNGLPAEPYASEVTAEGVRTLEILNRRPPGSALYRSPLRKWLGGRHWSSLGKLATRRLLEALRAKGPDIRAEAAQALGGMRESAGQITPALRNALGDTDWRVRGRAAEALGNLWAMDPWLERAIASGRLEQVEPATVDAIAGVLMRPGAFCRRKAAAALARLGEPAGTAFAEVFDRGDLRLRRLVVQFPAPQGAASVLLSALDTHDRTLKLAIIRAVGRKGSDAPQIVPRLTAILEEMDGEVVRSAARSLGRIGPDASEAAPALAKIARERSGSAALVATRSLGLIGEGGREALLGLVTIEDVRIRRAAYAGLGSRLIASIELKAALESGMEDPDEEVRLFAERAWARYPSRDDVELSGILAELQATVERKRIQEISQRLALKTRPNTLLSLVEHENWQVRLAAVTACASTRASELGVLESDLVGALMRAARDKNIEVRQRATIALRGLGR